MSEARSAPACPHCGAPGVPSDPHDPVVEDFPWTCPQCSSVYAADDMDDELLIEPEAAFLTTVTDTEGKAYAVYGTGDAKWFDITVHDAQEVAAIASVSWLSWPSLVLAQLSIAMPYRECGLGLRFISSLIALACRWGITMIHGVVVDAELQENPELLTWYVQNGFDVVLAPPGGHIAARVARPITAQDCRGMMPHT